MCKRILSIVGAFLVSAVAVAALLNWASPAAADGLIIVNPGESIQTAIDGALDGDTILIMAGTYTESLTLNKAVSLTGVSSATTILRAEPNDRILTVTGATITGQVVISGLMVTGGDVTSLPNWSNYGGGVALLDNAHPSFYNVTFYDNRAFNGGGLWEDYDQLVLFDHTVFISNTAVENFGAVNVRSAMVVGGRFEDNHCTDVNGCYGGAIGAGDLTMEGAKVLSNSATLIGGGIFAENITATNSLFAYNQCLTHPNCHAGALYGYVNLTVSGTTFLSNTAVEAGGGLVNFSVTKIINSHFIGNECVGNPCDGGGVWSDSSRVYVTGTTFLSNRARGDGGAIRAENLEMAGSEVLSNSGMALGGAVFGEHVTVTNSLLAYNQCVGFIFCSGGAVHANQTLFVSGTAVLSNTADNHGMGLHSYGTAKIINSQLINNRCSPGDFCDGGGLWATGPGYITGTIVSGNTGAGIGGGIYVGDEVFIYDSVINDNEATFWGGGIYSEVGVTAVGSLIKGNLGNSGGGVLSNGWANITGTTFLNNETTGDGGGVFANEVTIYRTVFMGNSAGGQGGAVYGWLHLGGMTRTAVLVNNLFVDNSAGSDGAALFFRLGDAVLVHNTIAASGNISGQAVFVLSGTAAITNTIITSHEVAIENAGGVVSEDYNLYFGNGVNLSGTVGSGGSSIDGDPDFIDPVGGDYHIGAGSAALDNGLDLGIMVDLDGKPRPIGAGPDRGAYEAGTPAPVAGLAAENDSPTVVGVATQLTATITAGTNVTYTWNFGDGTQGSGAAVSHVYPAVGVYTALVTASNPLNMLTATTMISIVDEAIVGLVATADDPTALGEATVLTASITAGTNVTYTWNYGDGTQGSGTAVSHVYPGVGVYTAVVTAVNSVSLMTGTTTVLVEEAIGGVTIGSNSPVHLGESVILTAMITAGSNVIYSWDFGDGSGGVGQVVSHTYGMAGSYTVTVTATNQVSGAMATTIVVVVEETTWQVYVPVILKP